MRVWVTALSINVGLDLTHFWGRLALSPPPVTMHLLPKAPTSLPRIETTVSWMACLTSASMDTLPAALSLDGSPAAAEAATAAWLGV